MPLLPSRRPTHRRGRCIAAAAATAALAVVLGGCSSPSTNSAAPVVIDGSSTTSSGIRGDRLGRPVVLSSASGSAAFHSTDGATSTLASLQKAGLMLLYFGYTHCPDVCPTTMADLGQAIHALPAQIQASTQVVFITSDPARDTTGVMKAWLSNFDTGLPRPFVGLTASIRQIDAVARSVGVPLSPPVTHANGSVTVEHGAQTLAFVHGTAKVAWLAGTTADDYGHDIAALDPGPS